jgi:hypothetical protein
MIDRESDRIDELIDRFYEQTSTIKNENVNTGYIHDARDLLRVVCAQRNVWRKRWERLVVSNALYASIAFETKIPKGEIK